MPHCRNAGELYKEISTTECSTHMIAPEYHKELYVAVNCARYRGYESSETNIGAALAEGFCKVICIEEDEAKHTSKGEPKPNQKTLGQFSITRNDSMRRQ